MKAPLAPVPPGAGAFCGARPAAAAGAARDAATNPSLASNTVAVTYNGPPPGADLINTGTLLTVQAGGILSVGTGGLGNQAGTLTNGGTLMVAGPLSNPGTLALGAGTFEVRGNLTNAGILTPGTATVTFSGAADQLLTPGGATLYRVVVNKPTAGANTLRLTGDLTVSNNLTLSAGLVNTKNGATVSTLRLPDGATLNGEVAGRYVLGALQITRTAVSGTAMNFGHGATLDPKTNNLGTVAITRTTGLQTADVSFGQNPSNAAFKGIDRLWTVAPGTQPAANAPAQLTLSWRADNDNGLTDFSQGRIWEQAAAGQLWAVRSPWPAPPAAASAQLCHAGPLHGGHGRRPAARHARGLHRPGRGPGRGAPELGHRHGAEQRRLRGGAQPRRRRLCRHWHGGRGRHQRRPPRLHPARRRTARQCHPTLLPPAPDRLRRHCPLWARPHGGLRGGQHPRRHRQLHGAELEQRCAFDLQ